MSEHFAAFSFVDRITDYVPAKRARGVFQVPATIAAFPLALAAEATGQLAAWVSMKHIDFRGRPVAALASETRFHREVRPGDLLELAVDIDHCDDEAVAYSGRATIGGELVLELVDSLGPMLPTTDFDAPEALAARFDLLLGAGAPPGRFHGVASFEVVPGPGIPGETASATLHVPATAPFFADHFPRRPVFPATLLLDTEIRFAMELAAQAPDLPAGMHPVPTRMTNVKVRAFTPPGGTLALQAKRTPLDNGGGRIQLTALAGDKTVATARLEYEPRP